MTRTTPVIIFLEASTKPGATQPRVLPAPRGCRGRSRAIPDEHYNRTLQHRIPIFSASFVHAGKMGFNSRFWTPVSAAQQVKIAQPMENLS